MYVEHLYETPSGDPQRGLDFRVDLQEALEELFDSGAVREASALVRILQGATYKEARKAEGLDYNQVIRAVKYLRARLKEYEGGL